MNTKALPTKRTLVSGSLRSRANQPMPGIGLKTIEYTTALGRRAVQLEEPFKESPFRTRQTNWERGIQPPSSHAQQGAEGQIPRTLPGMICEVFHKLDVGIRLDARQALAVST
jgi:hypothetical protein